MQNTSITEPRLCGVLGVSVGEEWHVKDDAALYRVTPGGFLEHRRESDPVDQWRLSDVIHLTAIINQPDCIVHAPVWTAAEIWMLQQLFKVGVTWISRDPDADVVDMWNEKPEEDAAGRGYKGTMIGSVPAGLFPSLGAGMMVDISQAAYIAEAVSAQHPAT